MAKKQSFEDNMQQLEEIVQQLEDGDLPLEKSMKLFEQGIRLSRECTAALEGAKAQIVQLSQGADGTVKEEPLDADGEEEN